MKNALSWTIMVLLFTASGCASYHSNKGETMRPLASALTKLSSQAESLVRYQAPPVDATDEELLQLATKNDPGFLDTFKGYKLRVRSQDRHAIILLCTEDGTVGLLEDLGCTASLDRNLWEESMAMPCEFSLSIKLGCKMK